jgi:hypothetical protein
VKSPFLLPLHLLLWCAVFLLAFTAVTVVAAWVPRAADAPWEAAREVLARSPGYAQGCIPAALIPAIFLTALRVARNPVSRPFSLLLPPATAFCILFLGPMALGLLETAPTPASASPAGYLLPGALTMAEDEGGRGAVVVALRQDDGGARLEQIVVLRSAPADSRLAYYPTGSTVVVDDGALLRLASAAGGATAGQSAELRLRRLPVWGELTRPAAATSGLLRDLSFLDLELRRSKGESRLDSILLCASLASFLCFSGVLLRMTRWPLLSMVLLGLLWRGALALLRLLGEQVRPALASLIPGLVDGGAVARNLPALLLLVAAVLFFALDLVFVTFDFWKRELES